MIYLDGLNSIIECIYLSEEISNKPGNCNIFVNPQNIKYLMGKTIIINDPEYDLSNISRLVANHCKIISRILINNKHVKFRPYILKICNNIMWNGKQMSLGEFDLLDDLINNGSCEFDIDNYMLYFPKLDIHESKVLDSDGNLTALGWVLQQVGVNIKKDTLFKDLDIIKTGKIRL